MSISPLDVRNQVFKKRFRGYDVDEVKIFLDSVADSMEGILKEKEALGNDNKVLRDKLESYSEIESALRDTLVTAQKVGEEARANAHRSAGNIRAEAELAAKQKISNASKRAEDITRSCDSTKVRTRALVVKLRSLLEAHLNFLNGVEEEINRMESPEGKGAGVYGDVS